MYPPGVEPGFPAPEAGVLSIRLRVQSLYFNLENVNYQGCGLVQIGGHIC